GAELRQSQMTHPAAPVSLPRTLGTRCRDTRTAALGEFEISASQGEFVLKLANEAAADLYRLWLIRLPERDAEFDSEFLLLDYRSGTRQIDMEMLAPHDGYLLFSEVNYPGWRARIDGREAEILTADSLFRALYVGAGRSRIELWFWPRYLILGGALSLGAVFALLF